MELAPKSTMCEVMGLRLPGTLPKAWAETLPGGSYEQEYLRAMMSTEEQLLSCETGPGQ